MPALEEKIRHVVVLMLENRSFDHMLGAVKFASKVEQPSGSEFNRDSDGKKVPISFDAEPGIEVGPDHGHVGVMMQLTGKKPAKKPPLFPPPVNLTMDGFVSSFEDVSLKAKKKGYGRNIMRCHPETDIPVLATLAKEYAVCDRWFCSVPGQTWPNRNYAHAATSDGETNIVKRLYKNRTIFEALDKGGKRWRIYHDGAPQTWVFPNLWTSLVARGRFQKIERLEEHVAADNMPAYTFIEPRHFGKSANSQHPENPANESSFHAGEALIKHVYDTLTSNRALWESTLLVITYDEHGGFYDHVPPMPAARPDKKASGEGFVFDLTGVRVPAVLVSPWIPRGTVDSTPYDHSSIPASLRELFIPDAPPLTGRDAVANTFWRNVSLGAPRQDVPPVEIPVQAAAALDVRFPVRAVAAMKGQKVAEDELPESEEPWAWLTYNVARALEAEKPIRAAAAAAGKPLDNIPLGTTFWESTEGRLITKRPPLAKKAAAAIAPMAAAAGGPAPIIITGSDELSAFGLQVSDMFHESAIEEEPVPPDDTPAPAPRTRTRRRAVTS